MVADIAEEKVSKSDRRHQIAIPEAPPWPPPVLDSIVAVPIPSGATSQFKYSRWKAAFTSLDGSYWFSRAENILDAIKHGVRLGYTGPREKFIFADNHPSANAPHAQEVIDAEIISELVKRRMAGPFSRDQIQSFLPFFRNSPMAVVPKPNSTKWRVIDDLSAGAASVNSYIDDAHSTVRYMSFDDAVRAVQRLGRDCYMCKIDWEAAFRQVAVHTDDYPLLGLIWRGLCFIRLVLPFGARSSPKLFTDFAAAFKAILRKELDQTFVLAVIELVYYLDDFFMAAKTIADCKRSMVLMDSLAVRLGVTLHPDKRDGPSKIIQFLGIEIDSSKMIIRLPDVKKDLLIKACQSALDKSAASAKDLDRIIGRMGHACKVVTPGRWMLSRIMIWRNRLPRGANELRLYTLPNEVKEDLRWWISAMSSWNGVRSISHAHNVTRPWWILQTDASGSSGAGAVLLNREGTLKAWISLEWPTNTTTAKWSSGAFELAAIAIALASFEDYISNQSIQLHSDSSVSISTLHKQCTSSPFTSRIMRGISAMMLAMNLHISSSHIKGTHNIRADVASRVYLQKPNYLNLLGMIPSRRKLAVWPLWLYRIAQKSSFQL
jgi:hypothetical protein